MKSNNDLNREDSGIQENFACGIQIPGLWNSELGSRSPESLCKDWNPESRIQDCLVLPYMEQFLMHDNSKKKLKI